MGETKDFLSYKDVVNVDYAGAIILEKSVEHGFCGKYGRKRQRMARR